MVELGRMGWGGGLGGGLKMLDEHWSRLLYVHRRRNLGFDPVSWIDDCLHSSREHDPQPREGVYQADISTGPLMGVPPFPNIPVNPPDSRRRHPEDLILTNCFLLLPQQ